MESQLAPLGDVFGYQDVSALLSAEDRFESIGQGVAKQILNGAGEERRNADVVGVDVRTQRIHAGAHLVGGQHVQGGALLQKVNPALRGTSVGWISVADGGGVDSAV